ncbi:MAG TPA: Rrf2 family transcriptional regulator [Bacteroidales bacterium]|nr:Rrf2 family transcriptional regulator [Bacteroidales bacterium]
MKTRYAIVAVTRLARDYGKGPVHIKKIAEEEKIPLSFLENILLEMKNMGILASRLGKSGGYYLTRKPGEVTLAEIVRHFEGSVALIYCVSEDTYQPCEFCKDESTCNIRNIFTEIRDTTNEILTRTTFESLTRPLL